LKAGVTFSSKRKSNQKELMETMLLFSIDYISFLSFSFSVRFSLNRREKGIKQKPSPIHPLRAGRRKPSCMMCVLGTQRPERLPAAFSPALSTPKRQDFPCLVDKTVDNVDNFPGQAVDKWGLTGENGKSHAAGLFAIGPTCVDRDPDLGYNRVGGQACRMGRERRQNGT